MMFMFPKRENRKALQFYMQDIKLPLNLFYFEFITYMYISDIK